MADIKIREMKKGTIKTLDKAAVALERIKNVSAKTKDMVQANDNTDSSSPTAYASDNISRGAENASGKVINKAEVVGKRSVAETRKNIIEAGNKSKELRAARREIQDITKTTFKSGGKTIKNAAISGEKSRRTAAVTARQTKIAREQARKTATQSAKATKKAGEIAAKNANKYGIEEYVNLIKAVMMQESGGRGNDPMQSSEGPFNKKYPKSPNGIIDPKYSIECGVQELKNVL